uniref:Uncharacterized protein LOC113798215 isoform X1 n=1 Tax=Dermatophagoides pteronyssinus TaxID=6956 RepID=A0A6P6YH00_DERPT|nr:uncharacterized protein LOC113798215 isoform X1 [Dermatophagoides pteronyssinus]
MALQMEMFEERKKNLRKFNEYFNSLIDGDKNEILTNQTEIRSLIKQIRIFNRNLAENDDLYDEQTVTLFNDRAHQLAEFLNSNSQTNNIVDSKSDQQTFYKHNVRERNEIVDNEKSFYINDIKDIDALLALYYLKFLRITQTNWFDYYSQIMEFIVFNEKMNTMTKMDHLKRTIRYNSKALELIENIDNIYEAIKILEKHYISCSSMEGEQYVKYLIDKFCFYETKIEKTYRFLLRIALLILYAVKDENKRPDYLQLLLKKLPYTFNNVYKLDPSFFVTMMRAKLRIYDCPHILKPGTYEALGQAYNSLIVQSICPICFKEENHIRVHKVVRCRFLEKLVRRYTHDMKTFEETQFGKTLFNENTNHPIHNPKNTIFSAEDQPFNSKNNEKPYSNLISLNKESNEINGFFTQQSSTSTSMPNNDESNKVIRKIIPITIVGKEDSIEAFIDEQNVEIPDAMIEHEYLKSLKIEFEIVSDSNTPNHIIGYVKMDIAIGFLIRTIDFAVFTSQENDKEKLRISMNFLKKFSLSSPSKFEQRFKKITERSLTLINNDGERKISDQLDCQDTQSNDEILKKLFDANFLMKSSTNIENDSKKLLKIALAEASENDYFLNPDNHINYGFDFDESLKLLKFKEANIYLLACEIDSNQDYWDTMLIRFGQEQNFSIVRLSSSNEQDERIKEIQKQCFKLLA